MNKDNLNKLIAHLEKTREDNFNMGEWLYNFPMGRSIESVVNQMETTGGCGTVACIAGHAMILAIANGEKSAEFFYACNAEEIGQEWLGLDDDQIYKLFLPNNSRRKLGTVRKASLKKAIVVLKHFRDTGRINWRVPISKYETRKD